MCKLNLLIKAIFALTLLTLPLQASPSTDKIDKELHDLENELSARRKEALNREMEAQPKMFENWQGFTKDIQNVEDNEQAIEKIKSRIQQLENERNALLPPSL